MPDEYQRGSDIEWLKHSNDELGRLAKQHARKASAWRLLAILLLLVTSWVVYRFSLKAPIEELWKLPPEIKKQLPAR